MTQDEAVAIICTHTCRAFPTLRLSPQHCAKRKGAAKTVTRFASEWQVTNYPECLQCPGPVAKDGSTDPVGITPVRPDYSEKWAKIHEVKAAKKGKTAVLVLADGRKVCTKCLLPKAIEEFPFVNRKQKRRHSWCRSCKNEEVKKWIRRKEEEKKQMVVPEGHRRCEKCKRVKPDDAFYRVAWCMECHDKYGFYGSGK